MVASSVIVSIIAIAPVVVCRAIKKAEGKMMARIKAFADRHFRKVYVEKTVGVAFHDLFASRRIR